MEVVIEAQVIPAKVGVLARAAAIGVAQIGRNDEHAIRALKGTATAWCRGLAALGLLEDALDRRHIAWNPVGDGIEVQITVLPTIDA